MCDKQPLAGDMEGIVEKLASGLYAPEATTWVKIKNCGYSQAEGAPSSLMAKRIG